MSFIVFFFNDTATTEIYTLSLHDALPILLVRQRQPLRAVLDVAEQEQVDVDRPRPVPRAGLPPQLPLDLLADRKSTRLNSSHANISYAVFCLKKKKN